MLAKIKIALFALTAALFVSASAADAQMIGKRLDNTAWVGMETVTGSPTKLGFAFRADGVCIMIDDVTPGEVKGSWRQEGDSVTISFGNCVYRGRIEGNRLTGFAEGLGGGGRWNFEVTFAPPRG